MCMYDHQWHDMTMYNLIMPQESVIKLYNIKSISHHYIWLPTKLCPFCYGSIWRGIELIFHQQNLFVYRRFKIWLRPPFLSATRSVTPLTSFFVSASILTILSIGHWFRWQSSLNQTVSPTAKFRILFFHIYLTFRFWRNSFLDLLQNSLAICCTRHHLLFEYGSGLLNSHGGGTTTLVYIGRRLLGESGISLFESLMVSTVSGLKLMISSASTINVLSDSSFKK